MRRGALRRDYVLRGAPRATASPPASRRRDRRLRLPAVAEGWRLDAENRSLRQLLARQEREAIAASAMHAEEAARLQAKLAHAERWDAMAMAVAALAHELNQPLTAASNFLEAARYGLDVSQVAPDDPLRELIAQSGQHMGRAGAIVRNLREFIDRRETSRRFEDINQVVEGAIALGLAGARQFDTRVVTMFAAQLPPVLVNKVEIQQVLINLFRNALQAMRGRAQRIVTVTTERDGGGNLVLRVADTGPGMHPRQIARLFQPFATTKRDGMGLGLKICDSIVKAHEGRIWATANNGPGVTFHIRLPVDALATSG